MPEFLENRQKTFADMNTCKIKVSSATVFVKGLARETREASAEGIVHAKRLQSPTSWGRLKMFGL